MPACKDCGKETPREEMRGPPDELRCPACAEKKYQVFLSPGRPSRGPLPPLITMGMVGLAVVASLLWWVPDFKPYGYTLVADPFRIWDGEVWRLVTTVFPHVNVIHLLFNLLWMWRFGRAVEEWLGPVRYAGMMLVFAAAPLTAEFLTGRTGIGLSGVVYGLFGLLFALRRDKDFAAMLVDDGVVRLFVTWFFLCIFLTYVGWMPIANTAHGVGAVVGWLYGRAILVPRPYRRPAVGGLSALLVAFVLTAPFTPLPWSGPYAWYRGNAGIRAHDYPAALYWYRRASRFYPEDDRFRQKVEQLEEMQKNGWFDEE